MSNFYSTYKELKPQEGGIIEEREANFYSTYKELKRGNYVESMPDGTIFTLPIRN